MSFEDAARRLLGVSPDADIFSEWSQTDSFSACDTCGYGTEPSKIEIYAYGLDKDGRRACIALRTFTSLPELWDALFPDESDNS